MNISSRKNWLSSLAVLAGCAVVLILTSCSKKYDQGVLIGNWQIQGEKTTIEFKADGTIQGSNDGETETGTYKFTDATHLQMAVDLNKAGTPPAAGMPVTMTLVCTMAVRDNDNIDMTMGMSSSDDATKGKSETVHFKRIK